MELLEVEELGLRFDGVTALDDVSFSVAAGQRVALVGPNGAGKTSVLNCVSGVQRPSTGRILVDGRDLAGVRASARAALGVARTLQSLGVVDDLTVLENLLLGRHHLMRTGVVGAALRLPRARREEAEHARRAAEVAEALDLAPMMVERAGALAPGARKRLELGRALVQEARLLLLDEPFAGAAPEEVDVMVRAIRRSAAAVVIVDHDLATVMSLAHHAVSLEAGRVTVPT